MSISKSRKITYALIVLSTAPFWVLLGDLPFAMLEQGFGAFLTSSATIIGSLAGFIGTIILFWQIILGLRIISSKFSKDIVWFNSLHKSLGKYGVVFILAHPFLKAFTYYGGFKYVFLPVAGDPVFLQVGFGRLALFLLVVVWFTSVFLRKKLGFRLWKYIHYFSYVIMILVLLHAPVIGTYLSIYPFLKFYWYALSFAVVLIIIYRLLVFWGYKSVRYKLVKKEQIGGSNIYTFESLGKNILPAAGQFCYIKLKRFGEEHPFTVMEARPENKQLIFGIKTEGKFTNMLKELELGSIVMVEGPYGVFTLEGHNSEPKVIIAGGIGVTPFVDLVKKYGNENTYMFYANSKLENAVRREVLMAKLQDRYKDVISQEKVAGDHIFSGRIDGDMLKTSLPEKIITTANYFVCGSKPFYKTCLDILGTLGVPKNKVHYEEFGF